MTEKGVDYSTGYNIDSLKAGGVQFAARYIGYVDASLSQEKIITASEAQDLLRNGIGIVSLWEWTADRASIHNTFFNGSSSLAQAGGVWDATTASQRHQAIGGPSSAPIYFAIDFSTDGSDCIDYFRGVVNTLGINRVGVYGPPAAVVFIQSQGLAKYMWGWLPTSSIQLHIAQTATGIKMGSMTVDTDEGLTQDFGKWTNAVDYKAQQFESVWKSSSLGIKWHGSGLYQARLAAFYGGKLGACTPIEDEQTKSIDGIVITDWNGTPINWQRYDDGSHGEWSSSYGGRIFDTFGNRVI